MRMLVDSSVEQTVIDASLLRIIARAYDLQDRLNRDTELTVHDVARQERVSAAYVYTLLRIRWLAPDYHDGYRVRPTAGKAQCHETHAARVPAAGGMG